MRQLKLGPGLTITTALHIFGFYEVEVFETGEVWWEATYFWSRVLQDGLEGSLSNHTMTKTSWECLRDNFVNVIEGPIQHPDLNKSNISCLSSNCLCPPDSTWEDLHSGLAIRISSNQRWLEAVVIAKGTKCQLKGPHACCYTICQLFLVDF